MIGIYGGTFNPVHYGHLRTAIDIYERLALDELRLLPCALPAHRGIPEASAKMRLDMLQRAIKNHPQLCIDDRELKRTGVSYMVDTLASIRAEIGQKTALLLVIGSDAFNNLSTWHQWQKLFDYAHIGVMIRPMISPRSLNDFYRQRQVSDIHSLKSVASGKIYFQQVTQLDISATSIRQMLAEHKNPSFLLPESVIEYIQAHQLYGATNERKLNASR